jgi:hypothetical protein
MTNDNDDPTAQLYMALTKRVRAQQERDEDDIPDRARSSYPRNADA